MAEKDAKLQDIEDVEIEDLQTEDEEPVSSVYVLAGKAFSISKDSQKTIDVVKSCMGNIFFAWGCFLYHRNDSLMFLPHPSFKVEKP